MKIFNTLSNKKEKLNIPIKHKLKLFVCGPTVYDKTHIGHARTYVFFDVVSRYLINYGYKVYYLQNITDIHDKITEKARFEKVKPIRIARMYEKSYLQIMNKLGIKCVNRYARATDFIPQIVNQIKKLIKNGNAYTIENDGIYFDLQTYPDYGKLSRRTTYQAEDAVSRVDESVLKRNKGDFCLWKYYTADQGEPFWKTELGKGRPGWHIEDTAITEKFFGPQYDIHGGGIDLKFPHHEAEIAQQESISLKKPFVKIWMHTGVLLVSGRKMSKSLGNFITVENFLSKYSSQTLRLLVLSNHYRSPIDYTEELAHQRVVEWDRFVQFLFKLKQLSNITKSTKFNMVSDEIQTKLHSADDEFHSAMRDDFNTPEAIASIHAFIAKIQPKIYSYSRADFLSISNFIESKLNLLGFSVKIPLLPKKIKNIIRKRDLLRNNKQFDRADDLRKELNKLGYNLEDTPLGSLLWFNQ